MRKGQQRRSSPVFQVVDGGCDALEAVSADFRSLIRDFCPKCNGTGPTCAVSNMAELADVEQADRAPLRAVFPEGVPIYATGGAAGDGTG